MFVEHKEQGEVTEAPAKLDEASLQLLKAAAIIEERGHCKGRCVDDAGRVCAIGALAAAYSGEPYGSWHDGAYNRLYDALGGLVAGWNNEDDRTPAEVVAKMRAVALGL